MQVLRAVENRILVECRVAKEESSICTHTPSELHKDRTPLHGCIHGEPGTGKSRVIKWITRMFTEAMGWSHGVEFLSVALQNHVAYAMGGTTLRSGGNMTVGDDYKKALTHKDIDVLFTKNQYVRWLLIDECFMIPDELLGAFEQRLANAAQSFAYKKKACLLYTSDAADE